MDRLNGSARVTIVSDLDYTMVDHNDPENLSLLRFNALWEANYRHDSLLVFSTGRSPTIYKQLRKDHPLLTPDITVMSVGTEITYGESMVPDDGWKRFLNQNWNRNIVIEETAKFPELTLQSETEQRPHKVSFYVDKDKVSKVIRVLSECLKKHGLDVKIIYSGGIALDILPQGAGKGQALAYLLKNFELDGKQPTNTLVCGDSGNDAELFSVPEVYGVMVSNAQEELLQWYEDNAKNNPKIVHATERCAAGIIQAIGCFGLGPNISPRDIVNIPDCKNESSSPACEHPLSILVHPSGVEQPLHHIIDAMGRFYGDKQGKKIRVWVDRLSSSQIGSDMWLVKFDKWELAGEDQRCCLATALLTSKQSKGRDGFTWMHLHQTWLHGQGANDQTTWLF